ncbi:MAG: Mur ligase family protein [Campylobacterota bacterium]|nr:Mur ligase family protein [Campylobacterota bacterium]
MLEEFLEAKPLYYDKIDYTRMPRVYKKIKRYLPTPKIVHIIGTNGKGTTGRFLASALHNLRLSVGHYTSPHILNFNERIWLNGIDIENAKLQELHIQLQNILNKADSDALSYFEYTTLLAILAYKECEYVVMEAGLGGEHDATAVFDKVLTLVTPIAHDHQAFLGNSIKEIATTKLKAIQNSAILAEQKELEVYAVADELSHLKSLNIQRLDSFIDDEDRSKIDKIKERLNIENYLVQNLSLSVAALNFLNISYDEKSFQNSRLFGRLTHVSENIIIDVGHNPLAAAAIKNILAPEKYILIYNTYKDKEYQKILKILKPIVSHVQIIEIDEQRIESKVQLKKSLNDLEIEYSLFKKTIDTQNYLVFGSFSVVESFLKRYLKYE